jgi:hypothetical protein
MGKDVEGIYLAYLKVLPWHLPVWAEENHKNTELG